MRRPAGLFVLALACTASGMSEEHWWPAFDGSVRSIVSGEGERPSLYVLTREASKDDDSPDNSDTYTEVDSDSDNGRGWSIQRWDPPRLPSSPR